MYMGGNVHWIDGQDADEASMLKLYSYVVHFGYDLNNIDYPFQT